MTIAPTKPNSLFELTLEAQEIDGELAIALDRLGSDDPDVVAEGEQLITSLLQQASDNQRLLLRKANAICRIREALLGKAEYLRGAAADRLAKAEAEERSAQRLEEYLLRCLQALHPGQTRFQLPEFTISSRKSRAVEIDDDPDAPKLPADLTRVELKLKLSSAGSARAQDIQQLLLDFLVEMLLPGDYELQEPRVAPDKTAIKAAIEAGQSVPGAALVERRSWKIQ